MKLQIDNLGKVAITVDNNYWNINKDYDRLVVVEVKDKFSTYLSRKPVPAGTQITNREYWIPFSSLKEEILIDYNKFINKYKDQLDYYKESIDKFKEESDNLNKLNKIILTNKEDIDYIKKLINYYHDDGECVYDTYSFIIDQRGIVSDPEDMVINLSNEPKDVPGYLGKPSTNFMSWLRANFHAYVGLYTEEDGMKLKQLHDENRTKFKNGANADDYINGVGDYEVFVKSNVDFYYKTEAINPPEQEEIDEDYVLITFKRALSAEDDRNVWNKWDKNTLVGVYEASEINNKYYSKSGQIPVSKLNYKTSIDKVKARGNGFNTANYNIYQTFCLLFAGYYSSLNIQEKCGYGTYNALWPTFYAKKTGQTNYLGMKDTDSVTGNGTGTNSEIKQGYGENIKSTNFWGLENYYGDLSEPIFNLIVMEADRTEDNTIVNPKHYVTDYIDNNNNIIISKANGEDITYTNKADFLNNYPNATHRFVAILDNNNDSVIRIIDTEIIGYKEAYVSKFVFGKHGDIIPKMSSLSSNENTYFCDYFGLDRSGSRMYTGYYSNHVLGGIYSFDCCYYNEEKNENFFSSRVCYYGTDETIHILRDIDEI